MQDKMFLRRVSRGTEHRTRSRKGPAMVRRGALLRLFPPLIFVNSGTIAAATYGYEIISSD